MKLRMLREYVWVFDCHPSQVKIGGTNPYKLINKDTLQYLKFDEFGENGEWVDVEIVEKFPVPPHPDSFKFSTINKQSEVDFKQYIDKLKNEPIDED